MPIYEYYCEKCQRKFEVLRPMSKADAPIECAHCHSKRTSRQVSRFAARLGARGEATSGSGGGGGCASCGGGSCSTCGAH